MTNEPQPPQPIGWLELPHGILQFEDLPHLLAKAMHPNSHPTRGCVVSDYAAARIEFERELPQAVADGRLVVRKGASLGALRNPVGQTLLHSVVLIEDLHTYMSSTRRIGVRTADIPYFVTVARPAEVPPALLELAPAARVRFKDMFPPERETNMYTAGDYRASIEARMARQGDGFFTLNEAAQILADSRNGMKAREAVKRFRLAHLKGLLPVHQAETRFPLETGEAVSDWRDLLEVNELDAWLRASAGYGFPWAEGAPVLAPAARVVVTQEPAPDRGRRVKRAALIADNVRRWRTVERDLKDAATNGLSKAARDGATVGWWWEGSAIEWARARAKVQDVAPGLAGTTSTIHRMRG